MSLNPLLVQLAKMRVGSWQEKQAIVPSDAAAQAGGGGPPPGGDPGSPPGMPPGGDPMAGGAPPGGPPSGPPPGDPSMGGSPDISQMIQQAVTQAMQQQPPAGGGGAPGGAGAGGKPLKPDINMVATDTYQTKKLLFALVAAMNKAGIPVDVDSSIIDGPGRDPQTGLPTQTPDGGSVPANSGPPADQPKSAIPPIEPMQGAFPTPGGDGGAPKAAEAVPPFGHSFPPTAGVSTRAAQVFRMLTRQ